MGPLFTIHFEFVIKNTLQPQVIHYWYAVPRVGEYVILGDLAGHVQQVVWTDTVVTVRCEDQIAVGLRTIADAWGGKHK